MLKVIVTADTPAVWPAEPATAETLTVKLETFTLLAVARFLLLLTNLRSRFLRLIRWLCL